MTDSLYVDGGLKTNQTFLVHTPRGQGYAKVNYSPDERVEFNLPTFNNTSQESEFFAILCGITECIQTNKTTIITDSQFCFNALTKSWKLQEPRLKLINACLRSLLLHYHIKLEWKPREENLAT